MTSLAKYWLWIAALALFASCGNTKPAVQVEGHYTYEHAFNYDYQGNHFDVSETGTMDFYPDGSGLDSAQQVYTVTRPEGDTVIYVFNYVSPSRWNLKADTFFFAGIKESFKMELTYSSTTAERRSPSTTQSSARRATGSPLPNLGEELNRKGEPLAQEIINLVSGSIDYQYKFHLDTLTANKLQWSFIYRDGHSDTWEFYR